MTGWDVARAYSIGEMGWIAGCLLPRVLGEGALSWGYEGVECAEAIGETWRDDLLRCLCFEERRCPSGQASTA